ncbi:prepilin-type N-terminal cleavage/methylation domain-containing protein [Diaphorobacter aerolatus]|uniref:Prepilin-type N-terminal cleavage/methylation domain-containing protein n=1 Tax=Diaphorobacter aerolatus TaxID=1288495 RepID=A0A7H0GGA9_9BURK|nr:prepilin-type N-terminal cleavage/methylation domain-containing protein [Diaphorobacter aerolatus]QNP47325.1 prepilin-type N-terminal cleavage/methylation domain-containing protein [Diaphorobacter aerolatus]
MPMNAERGMSLVELMVGLALGLLVIAMALVLLQTSQSISTTVAESTNLRQDANVAMRIMGQQIRQAGSIALNLQPLIGSNLETAALRPVIFEPILNAGEPAKSVDSFIPGISSPAISKSMGDALRIDYENFIESLIADSSRPAWDSVLRDCLGQNKSNRLLSPTISSAFFLRDGNLMCTGVAGTPQPIIANVKDFAVRLLLKTSSSAREGTPQFQYSSPKDVNANPQRWRDVQAVEVCMELESPRIKMPDVENQYQQCDGKMQVRHGRLVLVARQLFHIRSSGE